MSTNNEEIKSYNEDQLVYEDKLFLEIELYLNNQYLFRKSTDDQGEDINVEENVTFDENSNFTISFLIKFGRTIIRYAVQFQLKIINNEWLIKTKYSFYDINLFEKISELYNDDVYNEYVLAEIFFASRHIMIDRGFDDSIEQRFNESDKIPLNELFSKLHNYLMTYVIKKNKKENVSPLEQFRPYFKKEDFEYLLNFIKGCKIDNRIFLIPYITGLPFKMNEMLKETIIKIIGEDNIFDYTVSICYDQRDPYRCIQKKLTLIDNSEISNHFYILMKDLMDHSKIQERENCCRCVDRIFTNFIWIPKHNDKNANIPVCLLKYIKLIVANDI